VEIYDVKQDNDTYSTIKFRLQVQRRWFPILIRIVLWMVMLGLLSFCTFGFQSTDLSGRLSFCVTLVLAIVAFQFIISSSLPQGSYLTLIDKYNIFIFLFVLVITIESVIVGWQEKGIDNSEAIDHWVAIISLIIFTGGNMYFGIYVWRRCEFELKKISKSHTKKDEEVTLKQYRVVDYPHVQKVIQESSIDSHNTEHKH